MLTSLYPEFFTSGWAQFACGFGAAFLIMLVFGRPFIRMMHRIQKRGQPISENVPVEHRKKAGTPTMGGLLIIVAIIIASLLFMPLANNDMAWVALLSLVMFGAIGFADDYKKVATQSKKASNGLSPMFRLGLEALCVVLLAYLIDSTFPDRIAELSLALPFQVFIPLGVFYYVFACFVIAGSANAANITDGLDGMLAKLYMPVLLVLVVALYLITRAGASPAILMTEASGMYAVLGAAFGAVLGFLWFNAKPASIFMGDVGSLGLGAFMGTVAMLLRSEIILAVAAGMMVLILLSSFIQTMCFKITRKFTGTGRRVFLRAPLHHHFEELGWAETKIVERFFIASILFSGVALALLKFA